MYRVDPSASELASWGLTLDDYEEEPVEYWPDTRAAVDLFCRVGTQWRVGGMGALIGLDYGAIYPLLDRLGLNAEQWDRVFDDIQTLESTALEARREQRELEEQEQARQ